MSFVVEQNNELLMKYQEDHSIGYASFPKVNATISNYYIYGQSHGWGHGHGNDHEKSFKDYGFPPKVESNVKKWLPRW